MLPRREPLKPQWSDEALRAIRPATDLPIHVSYLMQKPVFQLLFSTLLLLAACRPDQIEHLKDSKRIGIETANWEVKRIMPADLLKATRWTGDSITATADSLLRRTMTRELAAGGVARAAAFCRPQTYPFVDSISHVWSATARRVAAPPAAAASAPAMPADTARRVTRPRQEAFSYERAIVLNNNACLRCHGPAVAATDAAFLQKNYPGRVPTGYALGQTVGTWHLDLERRGVAEFWTMKTRKKWKEHKLPKFLGGK